MEPVVEVVDQEVGQDGAQRVDGRQGVVVLDVRHEELLIRNLPADVSSQPHAACPSKQAKQAKHKQARQADPCRRPAAVALGARNRPKEEGRRGSWEGEREEGRELGKEEGEGLAQAWQPPRRAY